MSIADKMKALTQNAIVRKQGQDHQEEARRKADAERLQRQKEELLERHAFGRSRSRPRSR